ASVPEVTCTYTAPEELANGTGFEVLNGVFVRTAPDGSVELAYYKDCTDGTHGWVWIGDPAGEGAPQPTPADLAGAARAKAEAALPTIEWHTPAEWNAQHQAFVQTPTYVWFDDGLWAPVSATASVG